MSETFAGSENGLNIPCMAFANDSFFLGNTDAVLKFPYTQGQKQITELVKKSPTFPVAATPTLDAQRRCLTG